MKAEYLMDLCRICVERSEDYIRIYDKVVPDNTPFFYIINDVCQLDISENDGFPEYICKDCFLKISEFMIFKKKSHDAKLNFLSMKRSLSEASHSRDSGLDKEALVATSIIVNEMTSEGVTLGIAQAGEIIEEVITMPFAVNYEEVVTDDTYALSDDQTYADQAEEEEESPKHLLAIRKTDQKRNSKEREVAIILADGRSALLCKNEVKEEPAVEDTGQEETGRVVCEEEDEECAASQRRSFVAQAYYRSYLLEKERRAEERGEGCASAAQGEGGGACGGEEGDPSENAAAPPEEGQAPKQQHPTTMEVAPPTMEVGGGEEEAQVSDPEGPPEAVCCKKKMLAISKSLALSRSLELPEKVAKSERVVEVGSDLDVLVEVCGLREGSWMSRENVTPVGSVEAVQDPQLNSGMVRGTVVLESGGEGNVGMDRVDSGSVAQAIVDKDSRKPTLKVIGKGDRRGVGQGPRFRIPGNEPSPPKKRKKVAQLDAKQSLNFIQVITSEALRGKGQQLDLEQVGDILKTSLSGKKAIQVSEVGPSGKVFHVEPTIVKLKGMPVAASRHVPNSHSSASAESPKSGPASAPKREGDDGGGGGMSPSAAEGGGEEEREGEGEGVAGSEEAPLSLAPIAMGTNSITILGSDDGTPKTLLLTAPKEENSSAPALAILLRPLRQEEEEDVGDPLLEVGQHGTHSNSLSLLADSVEVTVAGEEQQDDGEMTSEDSEIFCNRIRLRAKKAMLGCIKKTLDELERMGGQEEGQGEAEGDLVFVPEVGKEEEGEETVYTCAHCGQSSYSKVEMGWHMKEAHGGDKPTPEYYCTKCDRHFTKRYVYRLHMEVHEMVREKEEEEDGEAEGGTPPLTPLKCHYCNLEFSGKPSLHFHEALKHQVAPLFPCALCPKKFLMEEKRDAHQSLCSGNRLECELCHKEYNVGSIAQHMRTHRGEKPYLCAECGKTFSQKGDLKRHTRQIHLGLEPVKPFLCSYCPKTFSAQSKLRIHERSHTKEKPFVCDECGKGFAHLSTLRKHRDNREFACLPVIEQAAKPYTCSICKKGWDHKYALTKHIAWVHERKRPSRTFPCPYCSKVYYCRSQLTYHERTHTKEKPFVCGICDKSFMYNSVRKAHMAKEHGLKRNINDGPR